MYIVHCTRILSMYCRGAKTSQPIHKSVYLPGLQRGGNKHDDILSSPTKVTKEDYILYYHFKWKRQVEFVFVVSKRGGGVEPNLLTEENRENRGIFVPRFGHMIIGHYCRSV